MYLARRGNVFKKYKKDFLLFQVSVHQRQLTMSSRGERMRRLLLIRRREKTLLMRTEAASPATAAAALTLKRSS